MDLRITIKDENGDVLLDGMTIYQDGSDAGGVARIKGWLKKTFMVETPEEDALRELCGRALKYMETPSDFTQEQTRELMGDLADGGYPEGEEGIKWLKG